MSAAHAKIHESEAALSSHVAFNGPIEEILVPSSSRPLDLVHLARQTGGDRALETEILQLFRQQIGLTANQLRMTSGAERKLIAHAIKGSARAVGAFVLSRIAAQIEDTPSDARLIDAVEAEVARIRDFIAGLNR
jgi:HPt (histidine-containing phosphotransfer) domain-containing protein